MKHLESRRFIAKDAIRALTIQKDLDHPDRPSRPDHDLLDEPEVGFGLLSTFMATVSMFAYVADVASSVVVCYLLYTSGRWWWWWMSVVPLVASLLVVNVFSFRWYLHDRYELRNDAVEASASHWVLRGVFHSFLLGPVIRYLELFLYGVHSHDETDPNRKHYQAMVLQEDRDTSHLALVGSFVKSAPQLVLQLYILTQNITHVGLSTTRAQAVSLVMSLVELSLSQCSYHRALRRSIHGKKKMTKIGTTTQFFSHFFVISSRVLALAAFASLYGKWIIVFGAIHWFVMFMWLVLQQTTFCSTPGGEKRRFEELCFNVVVGVIYVFCFMNVKDNEPTRWKYTIYYFIVWIENTTLIVLWYIRADPVLWYRIPLVSVVPSSLAAGLILLGLYYQFLHPNKLQKSLKNR